MHKYQEHTYTIIMLNLCTWIIDNCKTKKKKKMKSMHLAYNWIFNILLLKASFNYVLILIKILEKSSKNAKMVILEH